MLSEYVQAHLKGIPHDVHLRLGIPSHLEARPPGWELERRMFLSTLQEADLVYQEDGLTWILEFGVWRPQTKVGQLLVYRTLIQDTPGYLDVDDDDVRLKIVVGRQERAVEQVAAATGILVEVFERPWLTRILTSRAGGKKAQGIRLS